jgi:hypothetical protein
MPQFTEVALCPDMKYPSVVLMVGSMIASSGQDFTKLRITQNGN